MLQVLFFQNLRRGWLKSKWNQKRFKNNIKEIINCVTKSPNINPADFCPAIIPFAPQLFLSHSFIRIRYLSDTLSVETHITVGYNGGTACFSVVELISRTILEDNDA